MSRRFSARLFVTLLMFAMTTLLVAMIAAVVRDSLADVYPGAVPDTVSAVWTVGILLITATALATWTIMTYVVQPLGDMRRNLRLAARVRAIAEPHPGEFSEVHALRNTMAAVLEELDMRTRVS